MGEGSSPTVPHTARMPVILSCGGGYARFMRLSKPSEALNWAAKYVQDKPGRALATREGARLARIPGIGGQIRGMEGGGF